MQRANLETIMAVIDTIKALGKPHPFSKNEILLNNSSFVELMFVHGTLQISSIESFRPGGGRAAMQTILEVADRFDVPCRLNPIPYGKSYLNKRQLTAWYSRLGFTKIYTNTMERPSITTTEKITHEFGILV